MIHARRIVLDWAERGRIAPRDLRRALAVAEVLPSRAAWRRFIDRLLLWMGTVLVCAGLLFFLAYNWDRFGRFAKFGLAEGLMALGLAFIWRYGIDSRGGKAALLALTVFLGALLALIGQTYQTGADDFELFAAWAAMILPLALVGLSPVLWLFWLGLVNLTVALYFRTFPSLLGLAFTSERVPWLLFFIDTAALALWEAGAARGIEWLRPRWAPRLLAAAAGVSITALVLEEIIEPGSAGGWAAPVVWLAWIAGSWTAHRRLVKDLFAPAGVVLSVIVAAATILLKHFSDSGAFGFLLVGLSVIALSAAGGRLLKNMAKEDKR
jgi:uncharacterized membrane protein